MPLYSFYLRSQCRMKRSRLLFWDQRNRDELLTDFKLCSSLQLKVLTHKLKVESDNTWSSSGNIFDIRGLQVVHVVLTHLLFNVLVLGAFGGPTLWTWHLSPWHPLRSPLGGLQQPLKASGVKLVSRQLREMKTCSLFVAALLLPTIQAGELWPDLYFWAEHTFFIWHLIQIDHYWCPSPFRE